MPVLTSLKPILLVRPRLLKRITKWPGWRVRFRHVPFALGCLVVCPDCVGNRQFCRDGDTCFRPAHDPQAIVAAALRALALAPAQRERITAAARAEATGRGLDAERRAYLAILDNLSDIW